MNSQVPHQRKPSTKKAQDKMYMDTLKKQLGVCATGIMGFTLISNLVANLAHLDPLPPKMCELITRKVLALRMLALSFNGVRQPC
jgi:hypothetical protein